MWLETFFGLDIWLKTWSTAKNAKNKIGWCSRGASLIRGERDHSHYFSHKISLEHSDQLVKNLCLFWHKNFFFSILHENLKKNNYIKLVIF